MTQHLNGTTWSQLLTHLQRGGSYGYWWTLDEVKTYEIKRGPRAGQQEKCKRTIWWPSSKPLPIPNGATEHVYFGVHPTGAIPERQRVDRTIGETYTIRPEHARAEIADVAAVNCLFAEFDAKDFDDGKPGARAHIDQLSVKPSILIDSGGGYHAYWLLDEPLIVTDHNRATIKVLQNRWVEYVEADEESKDLARVLRVPGRRNVKAKYGPDFPLVAFVAANFDRLYTVDELAAAIPPEIAATEARPIVPFTPTAGDHSAYVRAAYDGEIAAVLGALPSLKHRTLRNAAIKLASLIWTGCLSEQQIADGLQAAAEQNGCDVGYEHRTIADGIRYGSARPRTIPERRKLAAHATAVPSDAGDEPIEQMHLAPRRIVLESLGRGEAGDAELFAYLYKGKAVYDLAEKRWYLWDGRRWRADKAGAIRGYIDGHIASEYMHLSADLYAEAMPGDPLAMTPERQKALEISKAATERAKSLRNRRRIESVLDLAHSKPGMAIDGCEWDADPWLLGVNNGVLDLRTGTLRDGRPEDYIRTVAPTDWRGLNTPAPRWERFVSEVLSDELDRVAFLQRLLGYALNGSTSEHVLGIFVGERGRNGKRVLFEALQYVLGSYSKSVPTDVVVGQDRWRSAGSAQPHLMELQGKRLTYCSETNEHDALSASQVKNITGGDPITARRLHEGLLTFMPTHTLFLQTNRKPQAPADDDALWERVKVIEFKVRFVDDPSAADERPRDLQLEPTLQAEASGILAWLVRGGLDWQRGGLQTPPSVRLARDNYRTGESIEPFLGECCTEWDGGSAEGGALYEAYKAWCELRTIRPKSAVWLGKQLVQRFEKARLTTGTNAGRTVYHGLTLHDRDDWTRQDGTELSTTLQDCINPSVPIETPKNDDLNSNPEGLGSISKSPMHFLPHEEKNMRNPSNPSVPSGLSEQWPLRTIPRGPINVNSRIAAQRQQEEAESAALAAQYPDDLQEAA